MSTTTDPTEVPVTETELLDLLFDSSAPEVRMAATAVAQGRVALDEVPSRFSALSAVACGRVAELVEVARQRLDA